MAADGTVLSQTATQDIGTGTYTVFTEVVADAPVTLAMVPDPADNAVRTAVVQLAVSNPASPLHGMARRWRTPAP